MLNKKYIVLLFILILVSCKSFSQRKNDTIIGGIFNVYNISLKYSGIAEKIPQLICSGILDKSDFTYVSLERTADSTKKQNNRGLDIGLKEKLEAKKASYYLHGSYSEYDGKFLIEFEMSDVKNDKPVFKYKTDYYMPVYEIYREIESVSAKLQKGINTYRASKLVSLKNIYLVPYKNLVTPAQLKNTDVDINKNFPIYHFSRNLSANSRYNLVLKDSIRFDTSVLPLKKYFDTLNADAIISGSIVYDQASKKCILQTTIYTYQKNPDGNYRIDSLKMPECGNGLYFLDELLEKATSDLKNTLNIIITDQLTWNPLISNTENIATLELLYRSSDYQNESNYTYASLYAYFAAQRKDSSWLGYHQLGNIEMKKNNYDAAINYYNRALEKKPNDTSLIYNKGLALFNEGQYKLALNQLVPIDNNRKDYVSYLIASSYLNLNDTANFFKQTKKALKAQRDVAFTYWLLGSYYQKQEVAKYDTAIVYYMKAYQADSAGANKTFYANNISDLHRIKGEQTLEDQKLNDALENFQKSYSFNPDNERTINKLRHTFTLMMMKDSVDKYIELGLSKNLWTPASIYMAQAEEYRYIKKNKEYDTVALREALRYLNLCLQYKGETTLIDRLKGSTYFRLKDKPLAIVHYKKALAAVPGDIYNYLNLAEVQIMNNEHNEALKVLNSWNKSIHSTKPEPDIEVAFYFLQIICKIILEEPHHVESANLNAILASYKPLKGEEKVFIETWSFVTFQKWLSNSKLSDKTKAGINEQLKLLEAFTKEGYMLPI